jgi:hypothetical protein
MRDAAAPACTRFLTGETMKKKTRLEADLDPIGTRHSRPGSKAADAALADSKSAAKRNALYRSPKAGETMTKKTGLEADLDPVGSRHSRPGSKAAETAIANSKRGTQAKRPKTEPTRPGTTAAARAVKATAKPRRKS